MSKPSWSFWEFVPPAIQQRTDRMTLSSRRRFMLLLVVSALSVMAFLGHYLPIARAGFVLPSSVDSSSVIPDCTVSPACVVPPARVVPTPSVDNSVRPPSWDWLREWQKDLPQHDLDVAAPDGRTARYVRFSNQAQLLGWNNVLTDMCVVI